MSNITTVYDTLLEACAVLLPNKTKIPNPYFLDENAENFLREGYGLKINSTDLEESEFNKYNYGTDYSVILTREVIRTNENTLAIETATKDLMEDMHVLRKDFYNVDQLGIDNNLQRVDLGSSSGVEFIASEKFNFVSIEVSFTAYIEETL